MSIRHEAREKAAQFLYQHELNPEELQEALPFFWVQMEESRTQVISFAEQLIYGVLEHKDEIDRKVKACADNWELKRMGIVDRNVMRLASFEMLYCVDIPPVVSINEAVDVAKDLSNAESGRFVNGILDRLRKSLNRPARTPMKPDASRSVEGV